VTQDGGKPTTGRITELDEDEVTLEIDEKGRKRRTTLALPTITRAVVQVEFSRVAAVDLDADNDEDPADDEPLDDEDTDDNDSTDDDTDTDEIED